MMSEFTMWLGGKDASVYLGYSRDWVEIHALAWPVDHQPVKGRIRYKLVNGNRKYYRPDLDAFLEIPSRAS